MRPEELLSMTALELGKKIQAGEVTAVEAAQAALDHMEFQEIVGSIAGDDTIMCAVRSVEDTVKIMERLRGMIAGDE